MTTTGATTSYFSMAWSRSNLIKKRGTQEVANCSEKSQTIVNEVVRAAFLHQKAACPKV